MGGWEGERAYLVSQWVEERSGWGRKGRGAGALGERGLIWAVTFSQALEASRVSSVVGGWVGG